MAKVILRQEAIDDLNDIWEYTHEKWSENQADKYYKTLIETCLQISKSPKKGRYYGCSFFWGRNAWFGICASNSKY